MVLERGGWPCFTFTGIEHVLSCTQVSAPTLPIIHLYIAWFQVGSLDISMSYNMHINLELKMFLVAF